MTRPKTIAELADAVAAATTPFELRGLGSKGKLGRVPAGEPLDLSGFKGIIKYEPEELILEVGAATPLADVEKPKPRRFALCQKATTNWRSMR